MVWWLTCYQHVITWTLTAKLHKLTQADSQKWWRQRTRSIRDVDLEEDGEHELVGSHNKSASTHDGQWTMITDMKDRGTGLVAYLEETRDWEQFWKGTLNEEKQEANQGWSCWMGPWQKDTPNSATVNWNQQQKIKQNGVITARICQLRQRTQEECKLTCTYAAALHRWYTAGLCHACCAQGRSNAQQMSAMTPGKPANVEILPSATESHFYANQFHCYFTVTFAKKLYKLKNDDVLDKYLSVGTRHNIHSS